MRRWLRDILTEHGFTWTEDDYAAVARNGEDRSDVRNVVARRGIGPLQAFAVHTDLCRDWSGEKRPPQIVVRTIEVAGRRTLALQDRDREIQIGGDDRTGVAIASWLAIHTTMPLGLYLATDEEIGLLSSRAVPARLFEGIELVIGLDRGNASDEIVTHIAGVDLCSASMLERLLGIGERIELRRVPTIGGRTDVLSLRERDVVPDAVNLTVGYHQSHGASGDEWIDVAEAFETARYARAIIEDFR